MNIGIDSAPEDSEVDGTNSYFLRVITAANSEHNKKRSHHARNWMGLGALLYEPESEDDGLSNIEKQLGEINISLVVNVESEPLGYSPSANSLYVSNS